MRVLVADDAVLFRRLLADVLASLPGVEVVGSAANGRIALEKVRELKPDLLTLDIEMPEMDGLAVLDALLRKGEPRGRGHCGECTVSARGRPDHAGPREGRI